VSQVIRKKPLRALYYTAHLFTHEFLRGDLAQKQRFMGRFMRRIFQKLGFYHLAACLFFVVSYVLSFLKPARTGRLERNHLRWLWAISGLENQDELRSWITDRTVPHIIVLGMGSVGDVLQITPLLRSLRQKIPNAKIGLLHRSAAAKVVLDGNPNVDTIAVADFYRFSQIKHAVRTQGVADLVIEIRSMSFLTTYTRAPETYRHPTFNLAWPDAFFETAKKVQSHWQAPRGYQRPDGTYTWPLEWSKIHYLDALGMTSNLPIHSHSELDFYTYERDEAILRQVSAPAQVITVQAGVDADVVNWAYVTGQRPTKLLPLKTWAEIVRMLRDKNYTVIQLGTIDDAAIEGVTHDLRGKTSLREAAVILRQAVCHLGTEGGLVHLAHAMKTKSVVLFGPTSSAFLGYPENVNLVAGACTGCWGATKDWYIYCPRGLAEPACMNAYRAESIVEAVTKIGAAANLRQSAS